MQMVADFKHLLALARKSLRGDHSRSSYTRFPKNYYFLRPDRHTWSGGKKYQFFEKFCVCTNWMIPNQIQERIRYPVKHLKMERFSNYFRKTLHLACLTGFWIRPGVHLRYFYKQENYWKFMNFSHPSIG